MLGFDAGAILKTVTLLRELEDTVKRFGSHEPETKGLIQAMPVARGLAQEIVKQIDRLSDAIKPLTMRITTLAIAELRGNLVARKLVVQNYQVGDAIQEIALTIRRELSLMKVFCIEPARGDFL